MSAPGWHADPAGSGQQRYFDGREWTGQYRPYPPPPAAQAPASEKSGKGAAIGCLIGLVGAVVGLLVIAAGVVYFGSSGTPTAQEYEAGVIDTCHGAVRDSLRDPESARFSEWSATRTFTDDEGTHFEAQGLVNARNAFGGYTGDQRFTCEATLRADQTIYAVSERSGG